MWTFIRKIGNEWVVGEYDFKADVYRTYWGATRAGAIWTWKWAGVELGN